MDFKTQIAAALSEASGLDSQELLAMLETPPNPDMGDFALPCFKLSKALRKAPPAIAQELSEKMTLPKGISRVEVAGGYLNFYADKATMVQDVLERALAEGEDYGRSQEGQSRVICIDYSSINIAKPFHMGHLPTTVIGHALYRTYEYLGYKCVGINHLGDWGTQFGKLIVAFKTWGSQEMIDKGGVRAMLKLYVRFHKEAEKNPALDDEARAWFKRIEEGDEEALALFRMFRDRTLTEVDKVYKELDIEFDSYAGESFYNDKMQRVIDELNEKHLLVQDKGAYVVPFSEEDNMPPCLILKADGATLYATRDIAAAIYRKEHYNFHKCLYVVAYQQNLHFKQVFKVVDMMGYDWAKDLVHVSFGMVSSEEGTFSTRQGKVVFLAEIMKRARQKTLAVINEKSPKLKHKREIARVVGVGALVFNTLSSARIKDTVFSWDRALNFEGETGPYCMYTHARCCSVLRKAQPQGDIDYSQLTGAEEMAVVKAIADFPEAVRLSAERYEPYIIARQVIEVCKAYNKFYFERRIIGESEQNARLALTKAAKDTIKRGLWLIGVGAPEQM